MARKTKNRTPQHAPAPTRKSASPQLWAARLCFAIATALAAYLLVYALTEKPMAGCAPGSACDRVMGSAWAYCLNVPVSAPAFAVYFALLICSFAITSRDAKSFNRASAAGLVLSVTAIAAAAWFIYLQVGVIKSICKYCTATHVLAIAGAILFIAKAPRPKPLAMSRLAAFIALGLIPVAALATTQHLAPRKTNKIVLYNGALKLDLHDVPLIGDPNSRSYVVDVFDYTCPDCHEMHKQLTAARARLGNSFAVICLPCPLDSACNPRVRQTSPKHKDACEYAKLGIAVRRAGHGYFEAYQDWFFSGSKIRSLEEARAKAESLAGKAALEAALADPWVSATLKKGLWVYEQTGRDTRTFRVPQLMAGGSLNFGTFHSVDDLVGFLTENLALTKP